MPNTVELQQENQQLKNQLREREREIDYLNNRIKLLNYALYSPKSEKHIPDDSDQLKLFEAGNNEKGEGDQISETEDYVTVEKHNRLKKGRKSIPRELPRVEIIHQLPEDEQQCPCCGEQMTLIGYNTSEEIDIVPAFIQVIQNKREKFACKNKNCKPSDEANVNPIKVAKAPAKIVPKSILSNNFIASIITSKFEDATPFYRLEKMTGRYGLNIPRSTMCSLAIKASYTNCMEDFMTILHNHLLKSHLIGIDETPFQVISEPDKTPDSKSYMWVFRGGTPDAPIIYFHYSSSRAMSVSQLFLKNYQGKIQSDGYEVYSKLATTLELPHYECWAHARREFVKILKIAPSHDGANYVIDLLKKLYKLEKEAKKKNLKPDEIKALRIEKAEPLLKELKKYLDTTIIQVPPGSDFGQAMNYVLNRWPELTGYVNDGLVPIDNNLVENAIRPFVIGRKNWLFNFSPEGAHASSVYYTLIETAKANGIEPYSYMSYLLNELPKLDKCDYEKLLPMNIDRTKIKPYRKPKRSK